MQFDIYILFLYYLKITLNILNLFSFTFLLKKRILAFYLKKFY